jgi:hypothetical protein
MTLGGECVTACIVFMTRGVVYTDRRLGGW